MPENRDNAVAQYKARGVAADFIGQFGSQLLMATAAENGR